MPRPATGRRRLRRRAEPLWLGPPMTAADPARASVDRPAVGIAMMLGAVALFAVQDTISKHLSAGYPAVEVAWFRYVSGFAVLLLALPWLDPRTAVVSRRPGFQVLRGVLLYASTVLFVVAIYYIPLSTATAIGFVSPLFLTALSIPFLGEKVGPRRWAAIGVGFLGVLVVVRPGFGAFQWPLLVPVAMAATYAFYQVATRLVRDADRPVTSLLYPTVVGCVLGFLPVPFVWVTPTLEDGLLMALLGLCGTASHLCLVRAFALAPATTLAPFAYTQLLWVTILGYAVFGDVPDLPTLAGAAVIVGSGLYVFYRERRREGL
jgi:drug/metabolite transporter (DMT)-like permease